MSDDLAPVFAFLVSLYMKLLLGLYFLYPISNFCTVAYDPVPRWGQATVVVKDALYVHGGKTDPSNSYGYSAAPTNNDLLRLSLSTPFATSSPPWQLLSSNFPIQAPSLSWHTLSVLNASHVLLFGGQPGPNSPTVLVNLPDSAYLMDLSNQLEPGWISQGVSWANEPVRRIYHSSATDVFGRLYVIGGEMADGSDKILSEHYFFQPDILSFTTLPSENGPPDVIGHASIILPDGRLLVFGGYSASSGSLTPLSTVWALNTLQNSPSWSLLEASNSSLPAPRRSFAATSLRNGNVLIHGGSDALQINFADGWILNTSQDVMIWKQVKSLSQLGARRDHFAVSLGDQVIFDFGYLENSVAPSALQVYDYVKDTFLSTYSPLQPSATQSGSSQIPKSSGTSASSGSTTSSDRPSDTPTPNSGGRKNMMVAIGVSLGVLVLIMLGVGATYHVGRRRSVVRDNTRFMALEQGEDDGRSSLHFEGGPIAISFENKRYHNRRSRWNSGFFNILFGVVGSIAVAGRSSNAPERRDILADEDTREFGAWHARSGLDGISGSSWSLRGILGQRVGPPEPSMLDMPSRRQKTDSSADASVLLGDDETSMDTQAASLRPRHLTHPSSESYDDPFADPVEIDEDLRLGIDEGRMVARSRQPYLHPLPRPLTTIQTALPVSHAGHALGTLSERIARKTLSIHEHPNSDSSHTSTSHTLFHGSHSQLTPQTSSETQRSTAFPTTSIVRTWPFGQFIQRSDSWWTRFSRTSFLDRRSSNASRTSGGISEFRDPNPPPHLTSIRESTPIQNPSQSVHGWPRSKALSAVYETHNKSKTSVGTADTEAIERMARTADVQILRSGTQRTARNDTTMGLHIHTHSDSWSRDCRGLMQAEDTKTDPFHATETRTLRSPLNLPADHSDATSRFSRLSTKYSSLPSRTLLGAPSQTIDPEADLLMPSPPITTRIRDIEQISSDEHLLSPLNMTHWKEGVRPAGGSGISVTYRLIPRPSLFLANPDHKTRPSSDA